MKQDVQEAQCGDIVRIAGIADIYIGETVGVAGCAPFTPMKVDEPTLMMDFLVNNSPFAGKE